jgi:hypothetical protein
MFSFFLIWGLERARTPVDLLQYMPDTEDLRSRDLHIEEFHLLGYNSE